MALEDDIRILRAAPLLADIPVEGLRLLAFSAEPRNLQEKDVLFREGEAASGGFALVSGSLSLERGRRPPQRIAGPGRLVDELALFFEATRRCTATALEPTRLMRLPRAAFIRMLEEYPDCAMLLHGRLAARLRNDAAELSLIGAALEGLGKR